ncbi:hypothetical protein K1T71_011463 [Dendrolimus kikuchii]|uniref:Uncharacterized protein n=1 Tax=Dendrolimus kikuchii TaxID=765133 RepID=A0ACC1CP87_9NEOP|nr:hypothetical protein K1T71_011463 [Dendrolimus kikuchii]
METDKPKPAVRRPDVLKKFNSESLYMMERGLLGELPAKLKPRPLVPVRGECTELDVPRPSGFLSSCLPVIPDSPPPEKLIPFNEESVSPLKKSFSFRDKFSRMSLFGKEKEKPKWKSIPENEKNLELAMNDDITKDGTIEHEIKTNKRFWFFRNREIEKREKHPIYKRSKSFEFLPRAIEEEDIKSDTKAKTVARNSQSFDFGSNDTMGEAWTSNESLEYISNVYYDNVEGVFLKSIKEFPSESSGNHSSLSTVTSASSANVNNIFKTQSVIDLLDQFDKAVEMFSETYLSDCEPYTKTDKIPVREKRKSSSFSTLPSPKIVHANKVSEISEDFRKELNQALSVKRSVVPKTNRRGSVTDWFVLEDKVLGEMKKSDSEVIRQVSEANKYKRGQKKAINRVRRMSSTKYVSKT